MADSGAGAEKNTKHDEHILLCQKVRKCTNSDAGMSDGQRSQSERARTGKISENLSVQIIRIREYNPLKGIKSISLYWHKWMNDLITNEMMRRECFFHSRNPTNNYRKNDEIRTLLFSNYHHNNWFKQNLQRMLKLTCENLRSIRIFL